MSTICSTTAMRWASCVAEGAARVGDDGDEGGINACAVKAAVRAMGRGRRKQELLGMGLVTGATSSEQGRVGRVERGRLGVWDLGPTCCAQCESPRDTAVDVTMKTMRDDAAVHAAPRALASLTGSQGASCRRRPAAPRAVDLRSRLTVPRISCCRRPVYLYSTVRRQPAETYAATTQYGLRISLRPGRSQYSYYSMHSQRGRFRIDADRARIARRAARPRGRRRPPPAAAAYIYITV